MELDVHQQEAVDRCTDMRERIVAVTGAAGTGKTTIIRQAYNNHIEEGRKPVLCAPTGKAAKRIQEATGIPAMTIHRLLEYTHPGDPDPDTGKPVRDSFPRRDRQNPIESGIVIADEFAMVNHETYRNLIDALPNGGKICLFGDCNQLKPIEKSKVLQAKPSPFQEILDKFNGVELKNIYRQGEGSGIVVNGKRILDGNMPRNVFDDGTQMTDFGILYTENPIEAIERILRRGKIDFASLRNQIITPTKRSWVGTVKLNGLVQSVLQADATEWIELPRHKWDQKLHDEVPVRVTVGTKVIVMSNNYNVKTNGIEKGVFNGETGIVSRIEPEYGMVFVDFGDRVGEFPPEQHVMKSDGTFATIDPRKDLDLAYCITTHKSQGSEYDNVVYVMNKSSGRLRSRPNFYTGITRAAKNCAVLSDQRSVGFAVWNRGIS